jgi:hypothetical protein
MAPDRRTNVIDFRSSTHGSGSELDDAASQIREELQKQGYRIDVNLSAPLVHVLLARDGEQFFAAASVSGILESGMRQAQSLFAVGTSMKLVAAKLALDMRPVVEKFTRTK